MKKKLLSLVMVLSLVLVSMSFIPVFAGVDDVYFTTAGGIELTKVQYDNLTKIYTEEELDVVINCNCNSSGL